MNNFYLLSILFMLISCSGKKSFNKEIDVNSSSSIKSTSLVILGTIQDAGSPQIGCKKKCCQSLFENPDNSRLVTSLGLIDSENNKSYLFEATPDIAVQMKNLTHYHTGNSKEIVDGIFLTHAHIGHYTGLMMLGKESMDTKEIPVYVMPKMKQFLSNNGPWSQLVLRKNIVLNQIENEQTVQLSNNLRIVPILVPHRDEFSETVGFKIIGPNKSALFIPDIDKWEKWDKDIVEKIKEVDYAFLDATFYSGKEINNRDISQIPHPFIIESIEKFKDLKTEDKNKIFFIHFNHTNPVIDSNNEESKNIINSGFRIARMNQIFEL